MTSRGILVGYPEQRRGRDAPQRLHSSHAVPCAKRRKSSFVPGVPRMPVVRDTHRPTRCSGGTQSNRWPPGPITHPPSSLIQPPKIPSPSVARAELVIALGGGACEVGSRKSSGYDGLRPRSVLHTDTKQCVDVDPDGRRVPSGERNTENTFSVWKRALGPTSGSSCPGSTRRGRRGTGR